MTFTIYGDPQGYYAQAGRNIHAMGKKHKERAEKYRDWQCCVRAFATVAKIKLPLKATKEQPLDIRTVSYFASGVHCDPGNVQKGVVDALFYGGSGDKYTGGSFPPPLYDKENPRIEVTITGEAR